MPRSRWVAGLAALAVQGCLLGLWLLPGIRSGKAVAPVTLTLRWVPTPPRAAVPEPGPARAPAPARRASLAAEPSPPTPTPWVEPPPRAAEAPLKLDGDVLRQALAAAPSPMERQARAVGQTLRGAPVSKGERLAKATAAASKPDCLGPDAGGSLLSVFVIAYRAATDKCK